jgi:hypothetical protein
MRQTVDTLLDYRPIVAAGEGMQIVGRPADRRRLRPLPKKIPITQLALVDADQNTHRIELALSDENRCYLIEQLLTAGAPLDDQTKSKLIDVLTGVIVPSLDVVTH